MNYLKERVAYLKGLAEGMQISESTNEGKLLKAIIDVLDDIALSVDDMEDVQEQLSEQVDDMDEDLAEIESVLFDSSCDDEEEDEDSEDDDSQEFECPHCGETIDIREAVIDRDKDIIKCPHCSEDIEIEWECDCDECSDKT